MDRNQFPRRMCRLALCLLAIESGVWWVNNQQGPLYDIPEDDPRPHSLPALDTAVPSRSSGNPTTGTPRLAID